MATTTTNHELGAQTPPKGVGASTWPAGENPASSIASDHGAGHDHPGNDSEQDRSPQDSSQKPSGRDALQALLAFSALHDQIRKRKALAARHNGFEAGAPAAKLESLKVTRAEFEPEERFVLDEVLQLVAERAVAITGADGLAIALAENSEIVLRAAAGTVRPDVGARIDRDSAFSGACFRSAQVVNCDDTEVDSRVNLQACRKLGARSMVAVPLCGRHRVIGLLEAFSSWPFAFNESDVRNLSLLAELILGALKPEDEDRFAESAQVAVTKLQPAPLPVAAPTTVLTPAKVRVEPVRVEPVHVEPTQLKPVQVESAAPVPTAAAKPPEAAMPAAAASPLSTDASTPSVVTSAATAILSQLALEKAHEIEAAAPATPASEPQLTFGQLERERDTQRPGMLVLLLGIVIVAAFAVGIVWKWKTAQLGSLMVRSDSRIQETVSKPTEAANTAAAPASTQPAGQNSVAGTQPNLDTATDDSEAAYSPATTQELAKFPRVSGIRHWSSADSSTVVLDLEDQVQYEAHRLAGPDRIYFDLRDTRLAPELAGKTIDIGDALLSRVRVAQPVAGMTRVVLETRSDTNFSVSLEPNPYRLVVEVRKIGVNSKTTVNLFPNSEAEKSRLAIVVPPPTKEDLQLRARVPKMRIVVDAGHGGWDLGTVGRRGLLEKDLVLEIAERLGKLLESRLGIEVIYTRQDDTYIPLDERANMANQAQADLFISVHANYSDLPSARGVETYFTNTFSAPGSKEAGPKEADTRASAAKPGLTPTLSPADLHERIEQSRRLAASVQRSLYGTLSAQNPGLRDRGIKEAGFVVLTESAMPGILAEVSFVSSPTDEQKLRSDGYREQIAEALYKGIARFAANSKGVKVASAGK